MSVMCLCASVHIASNICKIYAFYLDYLEVFSYINITNLLFSLSVLPAHYFCVFFPFFMMLNLNPNIFMWGWLVFFLCLLLPHFPYLKYLTDFDGVIARQSIKFNCQG